MSGIGDWLYLVAILVVVYAEGSSPVLLGIVGAARILPYVLLSVPAGVVADRYDRRVVLLVTDLARGVIMLALVAAVALDASTLVIVGLSILAACFSTFFGPAIAALLPMLVDERTSVQRTAPGRPSTTSRSSSAPRWQASSSPGAGSSWPSC